MVETMIKAIKEDLMVDVIEGQLIAKGMRFAIIASRFNEFISSKLMEVPYPLVF